MMGGIFFIRLIGNRFWPSEALARKSEAETVYFYERRVTKVGPEVKYGLFGPGKAQDVLGDILLFHERNKPLRAPQRVDLPHTFLITSKVPKQAFLDVLDAIEEFGPKAATQSVRAGLARARARGVRLGRPETVNAHREDVARLRSQGRTGRNIAGELGIPSSTVFKIIGQLGRRRVKVYEKVSHQNARA